MDFSLGYSRKFFGLYRGHWLLNTNVRLYGSGRAAFLDVLRALQKKGLKTVWIPTWQCHDLIESLAQVNGVNIKFYHISLDLKPTNIDLNGLDPQSDVIMVVDYFSSCSADQLDFWINNFSGYILYDCVHSWLMADVSKKINRHNIVIVSGFRKLFFKFYGAIVTGEFANSLPALPFLIQHASSQFPRNLTLSIRFGILSKIFLRFVNLVMLDKIASSWRSQSSKSQRQIWFDLVSPMRLNLIDHSNSQDLKCRWHWPDLYGKLTPMDLKSAESLKNNFIVSQYVHKEIN
jgi:hypothetical protein